VTTNAMNTTTAAAKRTERAMMYRDWRRVDLLDSATARGYGRVSSLSRDRLASLLADDDVGTVQERYWGDKATPRGNKATG